MVLIKEPLTRTKSLEAIWPIVASHAVFMCMRTGQGGIITTNITTKTDDQLSFIPTIPFHQALSAVLLMF